MRSCFNWAVQLGKKHPKSMRASKVLLSALPAGGMIQEVAKILIEYSLESIEDQAEDEILNELVEKKLSTHSALTGKELNLLKNDLLDSLDSMLIEITSRLDTFEAELEQVSSAQSHVHSELYKLKVDSSKVEERLQYQMANMRKEIAYQNYKISSINQQQTQLFEQQSDQAFMIAKLKEGFLSPDTRAEVSLDLLVKEAEHAMESQNYAQAHLLYNELSSKTNQPQYEIAKVVAFLMKNDYENLSLHQGDQLWKTLKAVTKNEFCKISALLLLNEMKENFYDARHISVRFPSQAVIKQLIKINPPPDRLRDTITFLVDLSKYEL